MVLDVAREIDIKPEDVLPVYDAEHLTKGGVMARIKLQDQMYNLRITRAGKLILTK